MAKKHTLTALLTAAYLIIMITLMLANVNITEKGSFENFYDNNGGLIWACTAIFGIAIAVKKYLDIQWEKERKTEEEKRIELDKIIIRQNKDQKTTELERIKEYGEIKKQLNSNEANDNKVLKEVIKQTGVINNFIASQNERDQVRDQQNQELKKDVEGIKKWISKHETEHKQKYSLSGHKEKYSK